MKAFELVCRSRCERNVCVKVQGRQGSDVPWTRLSRYPEELGCEDLVVSFFFYIPQNVYAEYVIQSLMLASM